MADLTLAVGGYTFTFNDGDVESIEEIIIGKPEQTEIAATGPMGAYCYDYEGVLKTIVITGYLTAATTTRVAGYDIDTIYEQKNWLESILNGSQGQIEFDSTYASQSVQSSSDPQLPFLGGFISTLCKLQDASFKEVAGDPSRLKFKMTFLVGN